MKLLEVENLKTYFHTRAGIIKAVNGLSFDVSKKEIIGIVGESGSGKSVACYSLLRLVRSPPAEISATRINFDGQNLLNCSPEEMRKIRGKGISIVFQDPMTSLNPYMRIIDQIIEPIRIHERIGTREARERAIEIASAVGIGDSRNRLQSFPHEFSGGMRQRAMIAMALITGPQLLIADEPTTALDVTVQAQILELLKRLQAELSMGIIFITHDLSVLAGFANRIIVMYGGRAMELGPAENLFHTSRHPYTQALLASIPSRIAKGEPLRSIPGSPPDPLNDVVGCPFAARCVHAQEGCKDPELDLQEVAPGHKTSCIRYQDGSL